jgi:hypothetical protein
VTYAASVFTSVASPPSTLELPRPCWQFYHALDGETPVHAIQKRFHLSPEETASVIRMLRDHGLIEPATETYEAFREDTSQEDASSSPASEDTPASNAKTKLHGDGAPTRTALHGPRLWEWLRERTDNVKDYKNAKAFIMMEAGDALAKTGVATPSDFDEKERFEGEDVVQALEQAVEQNLDASIPERCYC